MTDDQPKPDDKRPPIFAGYDYYKLVLKNLEFISTAYQLSDWNRAAILLSQTASWLLPFASAADAKIIEEQALALPKITASILGSYGKAVDNGKRIADPIGSYYSVWQRLHTFECVLMRASKNLLLRVESGGQEFNEDELTRSA